ncbi:MAG: phosphatidylglycerophosphatase A [Deltaproteobacteria bacterium]|nr:phosphatidylglycerophosphatase A [Deltaproteobacteria bacterium]
MRWHDRTILFLATGGGAGHLPVAPGTFGSILGLFFCFVLSVLPPAWIGICLVLCILIAVWTSEYAERLLGKKDHSAIVIDEIIGMMVTLVNVPFRLETVVAGFVLFRLLDIIKPPPIRTIQNMPGGAGVVFDDVAAGIIGNIVIRFIF